MIEIAPIWKPENHQEIFRKLLNAMSRPGTIENLSPHLHNSPAYLGVLATILDGTQNLTDLTGRITEQEWRFLEANNTASKDADYILANGKEQPVPGFNPKCGSLEYPSKGATILLVVDNLGERGDAIELSGPGIKNSKSLKCDEVTEAWLAARQGWNNFFPLGVDFILLDETRICALPRTTKIKQRELACLT